MEIFLSQFYSQVGLHKCGNKGKPLS
jgi:hypothetical protein